ncbi:MFS transporter [Mycoplasmatota bacterium]|nr:MFS transporter [Mycoplasmatota bacterium]
MIKVVSIIKYFIAYLFIGLALGSYFPVLTSYLKNDLKISSIQIGTLMAITTIVPILTLPIWGIVTDKIKSPKRSLMIAVLFSAVLISLLTFIKTYILFFLIIALFMTFRAPIFALYDEILINVCKERQVNYGTIRVGGSLGFAISAIIGYFYANLYGHEIIFILSGIFFLIVFIIIIVSDDVNYKENEKEKMNIKNDLPILFNNKYFIIITILVGITYGVNDSNLPYMSTYLENIAGSNQYNALAIFLSVIIEVPMLYLTKYLYRIYSLKKIFLIINIMNVFRYLMFFLFPNYIMILMLASVHGLTYSLSYPMLIQFTSENVRTKVLATAYSLLSAIVAVSTAFITYLTGLIIDSGVQNIFLLFLSIHILNIILIIILLKNYDFKAKTV